MKRILINATHAEEIRVALCNGNHLYDFDLENRTREQKKANIYKGRVTRVEPSLEAVFVEYGAERQGFLPIREIASEYLSGDPRSSNIKSLIKEGDELIVQVEKEERGNKGAALSTLISLAGRYLVLMPNNARGGGISRQISGKLREEMKQALADLQLPKGMSVIIRTAGIGKTSDDLQHDLDHLLTIWQGIQQQNQKYPAPRLVHQEAGVVTRAVRDYLRDDIAEIWIDNENAYNEAANFIEAVMPQQLSKLRKYTNYEPMFARFGIEKQIETAYQREVRLPSGGSIVIDQTEALVAIDINSSKSTKGADVAETAFNTNLEAADEIARQLRLRDMGGLIVIDFIDMATDDHQKQVENRIKEATKNDRARIQFAEISRFGLFEMSRQRLRPSLGEATGFLCPRCHGTGMIRDLRSLALSIMRQIEQKALQERQGEVQADVPTEIAAFLLNEKRDSLVYLEQESGTRITILPHAHLESPNFTLTYNREGFAPSSYERVSESEQHENKDRGYDTSDWHTDDNEVSRVTRPTATSNKSNQHESSNETIVTTTNHQGATPSYPRPTAQPRATQQPVATVTQPAPQASAVAWLSNLFAPTQQAQVAQSISSQDAAAAIESIVNTGATSLGVHGQVNYPTTTPTTPNPTATNDYSAEERHDKNQNRRPKNKKPRYNEVDNTGKSENRQDLATEREKPQNNTDKIAEKTTDKVTDKSEGLPKREPNSRRESRGEKQRRDALTPPTILTSTTVSPESLLESPTVPITNTDNEKVAEKPAKTDRPSRKDNTKENNTHQSDEKTKTTHIDPNQVNVQVHKTPVEPTVIAEAVHLSLDNSKPKAEANKATIEPQTQPTATPAESEPLPVINTQQHDIHTNVDHNLSQAISHEIATDVTISDTLATSQPILDVIPTQGRAKNDPREVYRTYVEQLGNKQPTTGMVAPALSTPMTKISGTVGQFITAQLGQVEHGDTVVQFIKAIEQFKHANQATTTPVASTLDSTVATFEQFFRNYGYQAITHDSVNDYHRLIRPERQFQTEAGTSNAVPAPVTQRASNDPRGQALTVKRAWFESQTPASNIQPLPVSHQPTDPVATSTLPTLSTVNNVSNPNTPTDYPNGSVGAWIVERLGEQGHHLIRQGQLVAAYLMACQQPTENTGSTALENVAQNPMPDVTSNPQQPHTTQTSEKSATIEDTLNPPLESPIEANTETNKGKTTPVSYKNMIESVAEQLKPSAGSVLNLPVPKVPKARTRKAKTTEKPKTRTSKKVENAVIVKKVKTDSDTNPPADQ